MKISSDFAGGNCRVLSVTNENGITVVNLEQELRDTTVWWFYWCFCVTDAPAGEVHFKFNNGDVVSPHGPCTSADGINWEWAPQTLIDNKCFSYTFKANENRYFAFTIPYVVSDFERFYKNIENDTAVERKVLTSSEKGRNVPIITLGDGQRDIIITARHHCCESTASYALEGMISAVLSQHREALSEYKFHIIPFVDIDGVEQGDQGKDRAPHDHNRDYTETPIYNYTRAIYDYSEQLSIDAYIDIHSPWLWGWRNDVPHIHFSPEVEPAPYLQDEYSATLKRVTDADKRNTIPFENIPKWNTIRIGEDPNYIKSTSSKNFFKLKRGARISFSFEVPYMGNLEQGYTAEQIRIFGQDMLTALLDTLKNKKEP